MSMTWEQPDSALSEFQRLCDKRECAALNCVNAIQFVLSMFEAQTFEQSREMLQRALDLYKEADRRITECHVQNANQSAQGEPNNGNRTAA
jgi:hypothetical protein